MHWYDWGAILLGVICVAALLALLACLGMLLWAILESALHRSLPPIVRQTAYGDFFQFPERRPTVGIRSTWTGEVEVGDREISVTVPEADGRPDPRILENLPAILDKLPALEEMARRETANLTEQHELSSIDLGTDVGEGSAHAQDAPLTFELGFHWEPSEAWGETVFVTFVGDAITDYVTVD